MLQILNVLLWNACLAGGLAAAIFLVQRIQCLRNQPQLCHALWLLVLVKLVTPPLFAVPVSVGSTPAQQFPDDRLLASPAGAEATVTAESLALRRQVDRTVLTQATDIILAPQCIVTVSALGTFALLLASLARVRLIGPLIRHAEPAPRWMQESADLAARQLGLKRVPLIQIVDGTVPPFLWASWHGPRIVVPCQLIAALEADAVRLIIKHELSHYARRDHWTMTFAATVAMLFWWNPVVWWTRRELRILQESCCDRMALAQDISQRVRYAETLLKTVDFVASNDATCPTPSTAFGSGDTLKRRVEMIVSQAPNPVKSLWARACTLVCALVVLPFGMTNAQDYDAVEKRLGKAVAEGEIDIEQAQVMMQALRRSVSRDAEARRMREGVEHRINEIKKLVEAGKMSREEGARLTEETRRALDTSRDGADEGRKKQYAEVQRKIESAVREGKLSREDAEKRLVAARKDIFGDVAEDKDDDPRMKRYAEVQRQIESAVREDKLSREDAEKRLIDARREIFKD